MSDAADLDQRLRALLERLSERKPPPAPRKQGESVEVFRERQLAGISAERFDGLESFITAGVADARFTSIDALGLRLLLDDYIHAVGSLREVANGMGTTLHSVAVTIEDGRRLERDYAESAPGADEGSRQPPDQGRSPDSG